jgi:hypothetical protein
MAAGATVAEGGQSLGIRQVANALGSGLLEGLFLLS